VPTGTKQQDLDRLRADIKKFKKDNDLTTVIVLWTANTERFTDVRPGLNTTAAVVFVNSINF
jgi:myo-inositol-1-phosphate synthase